MPKNPAVLTNMLPLLSLLDGTVLLPGAFFRLKQNQQSHNNAAIIDYLFRVGPQDVVAVAVPILYSKKSTLADDVDNTLFDLSHVHSFGTSVRIIEISRIASGSWSILLQGVSRMSINQVTLGPNQGIYLASVEQLDYFSDNNIHHDSSDDDEDSESYAILKENEQIKQSILKDVEILFSAAQQRQGKYVGMQTLRILKNHPPQLLADIIGSLIARTFQQKIDLLAAIDTNQRLHMVRFMLRKHLDKAGLPSSSSSLNTDNIIKENTSLIPPTTSKNTALPPPQKPLPKIKNIDTISNLPTKLTAKTDGTLIKNPNTQQDAAAIPEDDNDAHALFQRILKKNPPQEVIEAAQKEYRRLIRINNEHNPSHSIGFAYLEVLADLPWGQTSVSNRSANDAANNNNNNNNNNNKSSSNSNRRQQTNTSTSSSANNNFIPPSPPTLRDVKATLDKDHCGLEDVKQRIVQYVAVQNLLQDSNLRPSTILCLVGPPGTGKTSIATSIASALQRPFQRISLGGVRDEAEIRGHRRTYIGAMPGRITQALRRAQACDPVILLDEIDKTARDGRGDPSAALLEVLDPEQNHAFVDTYLSVPQDLSRAIFIATANSSADIPPPLLDRMEVIRLRAYTNDEKMDIAVKYLVPKAMRQHGLPPESMCMGSDALELVIEGYTREPGVRSLARCVASVCRYVAAELVSTKEIAMGGDCGSGNGSDTDVPRTPAAHAHTGWFSSTRGGSLHVLGPGSMELLPAQSSSSSSSSLPSSSFSSSSTQLHRKNTHSSNSSPHSPAMPVPRTHLSNPPVDAPTPYQARITPALIEKILGPKKFLGHDTAQRVSTPGAAAGLVWTASGGLVQYIECICVDDGNNNTSSNRTGNNNTSTDTKGILTLTGRQGEVLEESAQVALSWVRAHADALNLVGAHSRDVHIHLPAGATPKDGPSAGITLAVALISLFSGRCVRDDTALTGELTLRGHVLPVGGIKEKVMAAHAAGMKRVVLPMRNARDADDVPEGVRDGVELIGVERLEDVLGIVFDPPMVMNRETTTTMAKL